MKSLEDTCFWKQSGIGIKSMECFKCDGVNCLYNPSTYLPLRDYSNQSVSIKEDEETRIPELQGERR